MKTLIKALELLETADLSNLPTIKDILTTYIQGKQVRPKKSVQNEVSGGEITKKEFLAFINQAIKCNNKHMPITDCFLVSSDNLFCYDSYNEYMFFNNIKIEGLNSCDQILVDKKELQKVVKVVKDKTITLTYNSTPSILCVNGIDIKLSDLSVAGYPIPKQSIEIIKTFNIDNDIKSEIKRSSIFTADDELKPIMKSIYYNGCDLVSTDGFRLFLNETNLNYEVDRNEYALINKSGAKLIDHITELNRCSHDTFSVKGNHVEIYFKAENHYPNYRGVIPTTFDHTITYQNKKEFIDILESAITRFGKDVMIVIDYKEGGMKFDFIIEKETVYQTSLGDTSLETKCGHMYKVKLLLSAIKVLKDDITTFNLSNKMGRPTLITEGSTTLLVMPVLK